MKATEAPIRHLVIYSSGMIGDFMMLLGMSENARLSHPELQVTFLVTRSASFFREILGYQYPYIEVLSLKQEKETFVKYLVRITKNLLGIALSKNALILPVFFKGDPLKVVLFGWMLTRFPGSKFISFANPNEWIKRILCSDILVFDFKKGFYDNHLETTKLLDIKRVIERPMYRYVPNESVIKRYGINIPYIVMHIASTRRRWTFPIPRWEKVVRQVLDRIPDATIILTGSPADFSFVEKLASLFPKNKVRNCAGSFSASELVSVIHYAELYIGVDTGITHIAGNMSKKAIVIGHQYIPPVFLSYNPNGIVLFNKDACQCRGDATQTCNVIENGELYMRCTFYITDEMIEETLKKLLGKRK